jgi:hypothetical protein
MATPFHKPMAATGQCYTFSSNELMFVSEIVCQIKELTLAERRQADRAEAPRLPLLVRHNLKEPELGMVGNISICARFKNQMF